MSSPQGIATFKGVRAVKQASMTFSPGITPSVCSMTIAPQPGLIGESGMLELSFGRVRLRFHDCKVDACSFQRTASGEVWQLSILDRRWKWRYGEIAGAYNTPRRNGSIIDSTKKSAQELARLCLSAMRETNYDVGALPADSFPTVDWDPPVNPAQALAALCDLYRCWVVLRLDNRVQICEIGRGARLPSDATMIDESQTLDLVEAPSEVIVYGAPVRFQVDFELEAVGIDVDGSIKPIDDLSYKPAAGWSTIDLPHFNNVADPLLRDLARSSVFRMYRIKLRRETTILKQLGQKLGEIIGEDVVVADDDLEKVLPLEDVQVQTQGSGDRVASRAAIVYGKFDNGQASGANNTSSDVFFLPNDPTNAQAAAIYGGGFSIDAPRGIVMFADHVFRNDANLAKLPATLYLRTACSVRDGDRRAYVRPSRRRRIGNGRSATPPHVVVRNDVVLSVVGDLQHDFLGVVAIGSNVGQVRAILDAYLDAEVKRFQRTTPESRSYAGLKAVQLDGAVQQIAWSVGPEGAITRVSRNDDLRGGLSYDERRSLEIAASMVKGVGSSIAIRSRNQLIDAPPHMLDAAGKVV